MSSIQARPVGEAPPVFSYAQAAKGRVASTTASAIQSNQSGNSTPAVSSSSVNTPSGGSERGDRSVNGSYDSANKADTTGESSTSEIPVVKAASSAASPSFGTASTATLPKESQEDKFDNFTLVSGPENSRERSTRGESREMEKNAEKAERREARKGKKQQKAAEKEAEKEKEKEKEKEEVKPEILIPAPLPTVNFWQQRKEELAKTKPSPIATQPSQPLSEAPAFDLAATQSAKQGEKKRAKVNGTEENDKVSSPVQNGPLKDASKGQKKSNDGTSKAKDDQSNKRAGPRGSRTQKEEAPVTQLPPPVDDAISWPTPETALEEEKRKAQEKVDKEERDEATSNKPRPKKEWVQMPYTPSVTFNTPLPVRGGRGRGGARGGRTEAGGRSSHTTNGTSGEKTTTTSTSTNTSSAETERAAAREGGQHPRSNSLPPNPSKRQQNEQQSGSRKPVNGQLSEKAKAGPSKGESSVSADPRPAPNFAQQELPSDASQEQSTQRGEANKSFKYDQSQGGNVTESHSHPRSGVAADRRSEPNLRGMDQFKENYPLRERADGRPDRGRGGFRGRGNHNNFPNGQAHTQNGFTNGHPAAASNGYPLRQGSIPYSPPMPAAAFGNQYVVPPRNGRGGSRSQSIPNNGMYGRFGPNGAPLPQHMPPPLQTSNPMFDYHLPLQSMSAMPYTPYIDHASVVALVTMQLEYYFSIDNLCKDVYMRKHMDSMGFVFLSFIASFKRIRALTQELEILRQACQDSSIIELVCGDDGQDRIRRKEGWEKWVLGMEERDDSVKNNGPANYYYPQQISRPPHMGSMMMNAQHAMSPPAFSPNGTESSFRPYGNGGPVAPALNGNSNSYHPETPLSAAVADFAPGVSQLNGTIDPLDAETTFSDEEIQFLMLVFSESKPKTPYHTSSARTFSNGSIDGQTIAEELQDERKGRGLTNGSHATEASPDSLRRSRSPFSPISPTKVSPSNPPTVMWVKGQGHQVPVSERNSQELYTAFRARALKRRDGAVPGETHPDMKLLYEFWSHFLCRNFNASMYAEFRRYALEDSRVGAVVGVHNLVSYYDEVLNSKKKVISETIAAHYVELARREQDSAHQPAFEKLRATWRNGALDMKSRKTVMNFLDAKLKQEFDPTPLPRAES